MTQNIYATQERDSITIADDAVPAQTESTTQRERIDRSNRSVLRYTSGGTDESRSNVVSIPITQLCGPKAVGVPRFSRRAVASRRRRAYLGEIEHREYEEIVNLYCSQSWLRRDRTHRNLMRAFTVTAVLGSLLAVALLRSYF